MTKEVKLVIIGSGPAGHTAAIYAGRGNLEPLMFEGMMAGGVAAGGQLTTTTEVENFPGFPEGVSGPDLTEKYRKQSEKSGANIVTETVEKVDLSSRPFLVKTSEQEVKAQALIIATGAIARRLHIKGEDKLWQNGISACAVCDGALPLFRNKPLAVIGGGDSAVEEATYLTKYAEKVYMLVRRDELRASKVMQERAKKNEKVEILWKTEAIEAKGDDTLTELIIDRDGKEENLKVNGLFYAIGHKPNTAFLEGQLELDDDGYIITKPGTTITSIDGVFAAGDVRDKVYRQAVTAAGSGCMAAIDAERWLNDQE